MTSWSTPRALGCDSGRDDPVCRSGEANRSFVSGHALASFAGAGLVCTSHQSLGFALGTLLPRALHFGFGGDGGDGSGRTPAWRFVPSVGDGWAGVALAL